MPFTGGAGSVASKVGSGVLPVPVTLEAVAPATAYIETRAKPTYYMEFGGGLGDVIHQMFTGPYGLLDTLQTGQTAEVNLVCHNPGAREMFEWHPKRGQFTLRDHGYWDGADDEAKRKEFGMPPAGTQLRRGDNWDPIQFRPAGSVRFNPRPDEIEEANTEDGSPLLHAERRWKSQLRQVTGPPKRFVLIAPGAGEADRDLPDVFVKEIIRLLGEAKFIPVLVGKNYARHGRRERHYPGCADLIDTLTAPATALLAQKAAGVVACHSALAVLAWHLRKPSLLLYPEAVKKRHFESRDQWSFGAGHAECFHTTFGKESVALVEKFFTAMRKEAV
jgi:hypothetical protein